MVHTKTSKYVVYYTVLNISFHMTNRCHQGEIQYIISVSGYSRDKMGKVMGHGHQRSLAVEEKVSQYAAHVV